MAEVRVPFVEEGLDDLKKDLKSFEGTARKAADSTKKRFSGLKTVIGGLGGVLAGVGIAAFFKKVTDAASVQEDAVNRLNTALRTNGDFSEEASQEMQDFASSIQRATRFGDELVIGQLALAKSFGASNDQAMEVVSAATDMSAALGIDLQSAVRNVAKTLGGYAGELGEVIPELKDLSQEQLRNGEGIKLLAKQYKGFATQEVKTFSGALEQMQASFGDLLESLGFYVTENGIVIDAINNLSDLFAELAEDIKSAKDEVISFVDEGVDYLTAAIVTGLTVGFVSLTASIVTFTTTLATSGNAWLTWQLKAGIALAKVTIGVKALLSSTVIGGLLLALTLMTKKIIEVKDEFESWSKLGRAAILGVKIAFNEILITLLKVKKSIDDLASKSFGFLIRQVNKVLKFAGKDGIELISKDGADESKRLIKGLEENIKSLEDEIFNLSKSGKSLGDEVGKGARGARKSVDDLKKSLEDAGEASKGVSEGTEEQAKLSADTIKNIQLEIRAQAEARVKEEQKRAKKLQAIYGSISSVIQGFAGGASGARDLITQAGTSFANLVSPGLGGMAGGFLNFASQSKEQVRAQIKAFTDAIPEIVNTIAENAPIIIESIVDALPQIIDAVINNLPRIIDALVAKTPDIIRALANAAPQVAVALAGVMPTVAFEFTLALIREAPAIVGSIVAGIGDAFEGLISGLRDGIENMFEDLVDWLTGFLPDVSIPGGDVGSSLLGSAVGSVVAGPAGTAAGAVLGAFGIAKGGEIPKGYPNDTFPAGLTSGENVVDRSTNEMLRDYLSNQSGGATNSDIAILLSQMLSRMDEPQVIRTSVDFRKETLADILIELNRTGTRTA